MTVKELIARLEQLSPDLEVATYNDAYYCLEDETAAVTEVEHLSKTGKIVIY